jgi:hypothetical protein
MQYEEIKWLYVGVTARTGVTVVSQFLDRGRGHSKIYPTRLDVLATPPNFLARIVTVFQDEQQHPSSQPQA